jgi:hypothetical protein
LRYLTRWTVDPIRRTYIPKPNNRNTAKLTFLIRYMGVS